jgi:hypothetical protein
LIVTTVEVMGTGTLVAIGVAFGNAFVVVVGTVPVVPGISGTVSWLGTLRTFRLTGLSAGPIN